MNDLSILIPVYNEEKTLLSIMQMLREKCPAAELIYIDDGSKDGSLRILQENVRDQDIVLTKENGGKGSAVRMGLEKANRPYTVIQDADLEYDPTEISHLLEAARANKGNAVFGSRFLKKNPNTYKRYLLGNKVLTMLVNILFGGKLTDSYTCYKLFPTEVMKALPLRARGFELEAELSCYPLKRGISIREVPISYRPRTLEEGKKIRFKDAWNGFVRMVQIRLGK